MPVPPQLDGWAHERASATPPRAVLDLVDTAATAVLVVDADGVVAHANPAAGPLFGAPPARLCGRRVTELVPGVRHAHGPAAGRLVQARRSDGTAFAARITLVRYALSSGRIRLLSVVDDTARAAAEEEVRRHSRAHLTVADIHRAVTTALDREDLYRAVCEAAARHGAFDGAFVLAPAPTGGFAPLAVAGPLGTRLSVESRGEDVQGFASRDAAGEAHADAPTPSFVTALATGVPQFIDDVGATSDLRREQADHYDVRAFAALPLRSGGRVVAALCLASSAVGVFTPDHRTLLEGAADAVSLALDRLDAQEQLVRAIEERTDLLRRLARAQDDERARIAADLHDRQLRTVDGLRRRAAALRGVVGPVAPDALVHLESVVSTLDAVHAQLAELVFDLEPTADDRTLTRALATVAARALDGTSVRWQVDATPGSDQAELDEHLRSPLARIVREALLNVVKHAHAREVVITVSVDADGVGVSVRDDGVGVPQGLVRSPAGHHGLTGMRYRAEACGGRLVVDATEPPGTGTVVSCWLPRL